MIPKNGIPKFVGRELGPRLAALGFKKRRTTWCRSSTEARQIVDIQKSRGSYTFNFGMFLEDLWAICWDKPAPLSISETDCFPRFRAGALISKFDDRAIDKWWQLEDGDQAQEEIVELVFGIGIPTLEEIDKPRNALAFAKENLRVQLPLDVIYLGILECKCGEWASGLARLRAFSEPGHPWASRAKVALDHLEPSGP